MRTQAEEQQQISKADHTRVAFESQVKARVQVASVESTNLGVPGEPGDFARMERDAVVLEHMPAVRYIARRIHERLPPHVDVHDLISAGLVGLLDAADRFDGSKDVRFRTYAQFRIRGAILDSLRALDWSPRELRRMGRQIAEAIQTLSAALGRTPSDAEIAEKMGLSLKTFHQITGELKGTEVGSLDAERSDDCDDAAVDFVAAPAKESPLALCIESQTREQLAAAIETLPEKERLVLTLSYHEELTLKEIGLVLGVVESRVSQIRSAATARLRKQLSRRGGLGASLVTRKVH